MKRFSNSIFICVFALFGGILSEPAFGWIHGAMAQLACAVMNDISACTSQATGGNTERTLSTRAADVFNILDYGAKCDGTTNDNTAINAAFAAAAASNAYQNNNAVRIVGTGGNNQNGCVMNSINATIFTKGTGANTRPQVEVSEMTLLCTGAGNICFDGLGSDLIKAHDISIRGDSAPNSPEICVQVGTPVNGVSSAWNNFEKVNCNNEFTFTALYNVGSEANTYLDDMWANAHTASGPIGSLGGITGGSSYTNGTYSNVALTGGSGAGALATIVVAGNVVSTVTLTYQGRDYAPADSLSANAASIGGTGSGFAVPVSSVKPYAVVVDGQNYWRVSSAFVSVTWTPNTWQSITLTNFIGGSVRQLGTGGGLWLGWTGGLHLINSYILNNSGTSCIDIFDNGITKSGIPGPNWGLDLDFNCEDATVVENINFTGSNSTTSLQSFRLRGYNQATNTFGADSNITSVAINDADIDLKFSGGAPLFSSAKLFSMSGRTQVTTSTNWNAPVSFNGTLIVGSSVSQPILGPVDLMPSAAFAYSCARQLSQSYIGPLCRVERTSDSTSIDLYPDVSGNLSSTGFTQFCFGTTCNVSTMYDQSGNGNNASQSTVASQPPLTLQVSSLGNRASALWTEQGAQSLSITAASPLNDIFSTNGYVSVVVNQTGSANAADQLLFKSNGAGGWQWRCGFVGTSTIFDQGATTSPGTWQTGGLTGVRVMDTQYSSASLSNVPTIGVNGTGQSLTPVQPVGTVSSDASFNMLIGNSANTSGTRGFPGYIAEIVGWKATPTANQIEMIRRNQGVYYGLGATVN